MSRKAKTIWLSCGGALLLLLLLGFLFAALPWLLASSELPEGAALSLSTADGVQLDASWPAAERADGYLVEVFEPGAEEPLFSLECGAARCAIPPLCRGGQWPPGAGKVPPCGGRSPSGGCLPGRGKVHFFFCGKRNGP